MREKESLFERIFKQPTSAAVLPEENLATEVVAYFLDAYPPFREAFLKKVGIQDEGGEWTVETQKALDARGYPPGLAGHWLGRKPDITMRKDDLIRVLVEVKINAGPTGEGDSIQTKDYREYLNNNAPPGLDYCLVALTRWTPDGEFAAPCHKKLRFGDIAELLKSVEDVGNEFAARYLAHDWIKFLESKRWIMKIEKRHIDAVRQRDDVNHIINELEENLWDAVNAAAGDAVARNVWQWKARSRSSAGAFPPGRALWAAQITKPNSSADTDYVQAGCYYGMSPDGANVSLHGLIILRGKHLDEFRSKHGTTLATPHADLIPAPSNWSGQEQILRFDSVANDADVNDSLRRCLVEALVALV